MGQGGEGGIHGPWIAVIGLLVLNFVLIVALWYAVRRLVQIQRESASLLADQLGLQMALRYMEADIERRQRKLNGIAENGGSSGGTESPSDGGTEPPPEGT